MKVPRGGMNREGSVLRTTGIFNLGRTLKGGPPLSGGFASEDFLRTKMTNAGTKFHPGLCHLPVGRPNN